MSEYYVLFCGSNYYPLGGAEDLRWGRWPTVADAQAQIINAQTSGVAVDWWQVVKVSETGLRVVRDQDGWR